MPTDSELTAAAERLRSIVPDERMWDEPAAQWSDIDKDLWVCAFGFVRHILAQRADDAELVTEEWCRELLGKRNTGRLFSGGKWIPEIRGIDQWVRLPQSTTRGQLRQLLSALNVNTEGGAG